MDVEIVVAPPVPALEPRHAGLQDPVPALRSAVTEGLRRLRAVGVPVAVVGSGPTEADVRRGLATGVAERVAAHLLEVPAVDVVAEVPTGARAVLVLANGSATRSEKAPGHLDERAEGVDAALGEALRRVDATALADVDLDLAAALWADVAPLAALGRFLRESPLVWEADVLLDEAPHGVQYWVVHLRGRAQD